MTDLSTYEGRRAAWADELDSNRYEQFSGGALRCEADRPWCCCLGVACELVMKHAPSLLTTQLYGSKYSYHHPGMNFEIAPQVSFMPVEAYEWLGLTSGNPAAVLDASFVEEFDTLQAERQARDEEPIVLTSVITDRATHQLEEGEAYELSILNDAKVPFSLIAGLIRRECLADATTGVVGAISV